MYEIHTYIYEITKVKFKVQFILYIYLHTDLFILFEYPVKYFLLL